jgi:ketosteroid isomerase-like protein
VPSTKDVLNHHLKALKQGDVNAVLSDYAPGAVLFTKGADAIRPLFEAVIAEFENPEQHPK